MAEDARRCSKCGYKWFAKRVNKPAKTYGAGAGWAAIGSTGMAAGAGAKAGAHYATKLERYERWKICPRCGTQKVRTERARGFVPTAAEEAASARREVARSTVEPIERPPPSALPPPPPPVGRPTEPDVDSRQVAARSLEGESKDAGHGRQGARRFGFAILCILLGPIALVCGGEAARRTGRRVGDLVGDSVGRRPLLVAFAGVLGTAAYGGVIAENIALAAGAAAPADGEVGAAAVVGWVIGALVASVLILVINQGAFRRMRLPDALSKPVRRS